MRYDWMDEFLLSKRGVTKDLQADWNWVRYHVGGKMFAAILLDRENKPYYINLKLEPAEGEFLRQQYEDIIPGYYSNKMHWNSVKPDGAVPDDLLKDLLEKSYGLVLRGFSKKRQREILGLSCCGTDCTTCAGYGDLCQGCNGACGKVFHANDGKACPIYACCVQKNKYATCGECEKVHSEESAQMSASVNGHTPSGADSSISCHIWKATKDPQMSDEEFAQNIQERVDRLCTM